MNIFRATWHAFNFFLYKMFPTTNFFFVLHPHSPITFLMVRPFQDSAVSISILCINISVYVPCTGKRTIGHLHNDVILLLGPESFKVLNLAGITKYKYERKNEKNSGRSSKMTSSCRWPIINHLCFVFGL